MHKKPKGVRIPYALSVYDSREEKKVLGVMREHRTNMGVETREFERRVAEAFGKKYGIMVNSGSSANLLAVELLDLPAGSEVITPILTFSTTVAPLVQKGLVPVFADVEEGKYTINVSQIESLITKKTKALMVPLLLGNVPDLRKIKAIAKKHSLLFVEDSCDTLGATLRGAPSGKFSDISTTSFFGSHIITAGGNGGMLMVNSPAMKDRAKVLRGWGRSSALFGETEDISKRFMGRLGKLPYDAKFIFDEVGYNLLPVEMCSAFGNAQLDKLNIFRKTREHNFSFLLKFFKKYEEFFVLPIQNPDSKTQWIAFPLTIKKSAPFSRIELLTFLEEHNIQTRPIFTGNILSQPGFKKISHRSIKEGFPITNGIMERGFVVGCHHGLTQKQLNRMTEAVRKFLEKHTS
ncbi:MAG: aminotransferase class I/II-fold pyridoxal phosphate-dependent enzyme [Patescibacteria group bacterium]